MKQRLLLLMVLVFASAMFVSAQQMNPLAAGEYLTSDIEKESVRGVPVPKKIECKVAESDADQIKIGFRTPNSRYFTYTTYHRLKDNTFAPKNAKGVFISPVASYLVVTSANSMETYKMNGNSVDDFTIVAPKDAKFKTLKKAAKGRISGFDAQAMNTAVTNRNTEMAEALAAEEAQREAERKAKIEAEAAAKEKARKEREAKAKADAAAAAQARAEADLCTPLANYIKMIPANFKSLEGKLDKEETEIEEENVYFTNEVMPLFYFGRVTPTWKDGVKELQFRTKYYRTFAEADEELAFIQSKIDPCYKNKNGYKYNLDSKMHFYKSSSVMVTLMRVRDYDSDFNKVYRVLLQVKKR